MSVSRRPGTAPLEFVLVLPLLVGLFACILWIGRAGAARTAALSEARERSWAGQSTADPGEVLRLNHNPAVSLSEYRAEQPYRGGGPNSQREMVATAITGTHFRTWSYEDALGSGAGSDAAGMELLRLLVARNPESFANSGALLPSLDATRFIDPTVSK